ncbi:extracellular solute-binding protein, family 3 [Thermosinus carboxydivorans Nor1]|uniref:Extracellular solute-binding protein, family 3 n=1 Tax=Thermosinus carboxydivorans Nor1 TaxID=401526 RepID=A1HS58_9FIRM|nr:ABC transporter substrate-binding protein [Thermosinus carboxydivorans]EAX47123.1 extracellular solute-binding protein, family 3 [Thermosinus carboxydivorans Nor1]
MKNKKIQVFLLCILAIFLLLTGCGQAPAKKKVSIAALKLTSSAPIFIGIEKGFFKDEGIELEVQWFDAAQPIAVATASNKVDIGATGITASLFNMVASGQQLSLVADKGREQKGYSSSAVVVTTELWEQGARNIADLKGKRIGITQAGSTFHYMIGRLLEANGLSLNDVQIVPLAKVSALMAGLQSKQVDAVILNEPNISKVVSAGYGKVLVSVGDVMEYQTSAIFFSPDFVKDKDTAIRFLKGYIKATRYYYDAVLAQKEGKPAAGGNYDEVINIIAKYTGAPAADIKAGLPYIDRDGKLLSDDIQTQITWYAKHQMIDKPIVSSQIVNTALWEEALRQVK